MPVPTAPTNVVIDFNNGMLGLSWAYLSTESVTAFKVYMGTSSGTETLLDTGMASAPFFPFSSTSEGYQALGLSNGTTYFFKIKATNGSGDSAFSAEVSSTPQNVADGTTNAYVSSATSCSDPTPSLTIVAGKAYTLSQTWNNTGTSTWTEANYYRLETISGTLAVAGVRLLLPASGGSGVSSIGNGQNGRFSRSGILTAPNTAGTYGIVVGIIQEFIRNPGVIGPNSPSVSVTVIPDVPVAPSATPGCGQVALAWTAGTGATGYNIYRSDSPRNALTVHLQLPVFATGTGNSYTDSTPLPGRQYWYYIQSKATVSSVDYLSIVCVAATQGNSSVFGLPLIPTGTNVTAGCAQIVVAWGDMGTCALSYNVYRRPEGGGFAAPVNVLTNNYTDTTVIPGQKYGYQVTVIGINGETPLDPSLVFWGASRLPGQVTGLAAVPGDGQVSLSWNAVTGDGVTYTILRGEQGAETVLVTGITALAYIDKTAVNNDPAWYQVMAVSACGSGAVSAEVYALPQCCLNEWATGADCVTPWSKSSC